MNNSEKIEVLYRNFGDTVRVFERKKILGLVPWTVSRGWIWIREKKGRWVVSLANGKTKHSSWNAPVFEADFRKADGERMVAPGGFTGVWESAISMWPVSNEEKAVQVFNLIVKRVELAHRYYFEGGKP